MLRSLYIFDSFSGGINYRRQIPMFKVGPRAERVNLRQLKNLEKHLFKPSVFKDLKSNKNQKMNFLALKSIGYFVERCVTSKILDVSRYFYKV